jgi:hypothetical protein
MVVRGLTDICLPAFLLKGKDLGSTYYVDGEWYKTLPSWVV